MRDWVMVGAGSFARSNAALFHLDLLQYYDVPREPGETIHGIPVQLEFLKDPSGLKFTSCIGETRPKRDKIKGLGFFEPLQWPNVVADVVEIHRGTIKIGRGNIIQPWVSIRPYAKVGNHNLICGQTNIGHHIEIGDYCTISPKTTLCGNIKIKDGVFLGAGCTIIPGRVVGEGAVVGAGAVVIKDIPPNQVVVGNPARIIRGEEYW